VTKGRWGWKRWESLFEFSIASLFSFVSHPPSLLILCVCVACVGVCSLFHPFFCVLLSLSCEGEREREKSETRVWAHDNDNNNNNERVRVRACGFPSHHLFFCLSSYQSSRHESLFIFSFWRERAASKPGEGLSTHAAQKEKNRGK
jgi:heme-degrading monooxygenase HmoA